MFLFLFPAAWCHAEQGWGSQGEEAALSLVKHPRLAAVVQSV